MTRSIVASPTRASTRLLAHLAALATASAVQAQSRIVYVDDDAPAGGDGASWSHAFNDLQDALDAIRYSGDVFSPIDLELRIAQGVYHPDRGTGSRHMPFEFRSTITSGMSLSVLGGFAGLSSPTPDRRDIAAYRTILSGDLNDDDFPGQFIRADNSFTIVNAGDCGSMLFDGLEISGAFAPFGEGQAMMLTPTWRGTRERDVVLRRCTFTENLSGAYRAALAIWGSDRQVGVRIEDCEFLANTCIQLYQDRRGAGAVWAQGGEVTFTRDRFLGNSSESNGGAVEISSYTDVSFTDCLFASNAAFGEGGAVYIRTDGDFYTPPPLFNRCTFFDNAARPGAAVALQFGQFRNCIMHDGPLSAFSTSLVHVLDSFNKPNIVSVERCDVERGLDAFSGSGAINWQDGNIDADPLLDDDYRPTAGSPCIDAGQPVTPGFRELDLSGLPRFFDGNGDGIPRLDMGALEYQLPPCLADIDHSGFVDTDDFDAFIHAFESGC